jgi:multiple antibiotic resistance protein
MMTIFLSTFISLFTLINPLGAIPVFLTLTSNNDRNWIKRQTLKTSLNVFFICLCSFLFGNYILTFFGISISALQIAGGIIISRSGFLLLNFKHKKDVSKKNQLEYKTKEDISFTPLAMPLLSGPGSISFLINCSLNLNSDYLSCCLVVIAILTVCALIYVIFMFAPKIIFVLGTVGLKALSKIMGFIVLSIGIQLIITSVLNIVLKCK